MDDVMETGKALMADRPNYLTQLNEEQSMTSDLVSTLENRLLVVSDPEPVKDEAGSQLAERMGPHISSAVYAQRRLNSRLAYIIRTLVV